MYFIQHTFHGYWFTITVLVDATPVIYKYDRTTGASLSGAVYEIYQDTNLNGYLDDEDTYIETLSATDSSGMAKTSSLDEGWYIAHEITAPDGYNLDSEDLVFQVTTGGGYVDIYATDTVAPIIYKQARDGEDEGEYLEGAVYEVWLDVDGDGEIDEDIDELVDTTEPTDENGETTVTSLEVGEYIVREIEAPEGYNLDSDEYYFEITTDGGNVTIYTDDSVITSNITVYKEATTDSEITGLTASTLLANATFEIYDEDGNLVDTITTDENGKAEIELEYGVYTIKEVESPEYYLLDEENIATITVDTDGEEIELTFGDEAVSLGLEITKTGIVQTQANDEIRYDFTIQNNSNVDVDNFTWRDELPYEYITITSLFTGTYNYEHDYTVWYLLEGSDEWVQLVHEDTEDGTYSTLENNYIDFSGIDGTITQFKIEFGTVEGDFASNEDDSPFIFCTVNDTVVADDSWTNYTYLTGDYTSNQGSIVYLEDQDEWTTTSYAYGLSISKLPQTGF